MCVPGATRSGFLHFSQPFVRAEYEATTSSLSLVDPIVLNAPIPTTYGAYAGSESPRPFPPPEPVLPAAATTMIPCFHACSAAYASGSAPYAWVESVPYERLITRMFMPGSCACWTTQP